MISSIYLFEVINVAIPESEICLWIPATAAAAAVNPNSIKTLLAEGISVVFLKGETGLSNGPQSLPKSPPDYTCLDSYVFISVDELQKLYGALKVYYQLTINYEEN